MTAQHSTSRISLIGTIHTDPLLIERMYAALSSLTPDSISIELTPEGYLEQQAWATVFAHPGAREKTEQGLAERGWHAATFRGLRTYLAGDSIAIDRYRSERLADLAFVEDPVFYRSDLFKHHEEAGSRMAEELANEASSIERADELYSYSWPDEPLSERTVAAWRRRDAYAERIIRSLHGSIVHFGGMDHLFGPYENLARRLRDLEPRVHELREFEPSSLNP